MVAGDFEAEIDRLQARYIAALDGKRMKDWLDTFSRREDSAYLCTSAENVAAKLPLALMLDDNRARLADRVVFIERIWAGTFQDYRTRHFLQRVSWEQTGEARYAALTNFSVMFTPEEAGDTRPLVCGVYEDDLIVEDGQLRFLSKKAITDTIVLPRYLVYPV